MVRDDLCYPAAEFMETKYNGHIQKYGIPAFGKIVLYIYLNRLTLLEAVKYN